MPCCVQGWPNGKLCVAIGNVELLESSFVAALDRKPNRGYEQYKQLSKILDEAIDQKVDLLVLPENYLPFEWLPIVARICSNNQMALVIGIEHLIVSSGDREKKGKAVNLTATILPYMHQQQKFAYVAYHNKTAYSPDEKLYIENYNLTYREGKTCHLFNWRDVWFPVYCCFGLASIRDRALLHSCADLVAAVEWNKDIAYFSSIIESMCRDLHCYCIQANSSGPGDSRVLQPTSSEKRDIVKTKGGKNPCILAADIDIEESFYRRSLCYSGFTAVDRQWCYGYSAVLDVRLVINSMENCPQRYMDDNSLGKIAAGSETQKILLPTGRFEWRRETISKLLPTKSTLAGYCSRKPIALAFLK